MNTILFVFISQAADRIAIFLRTAVRSSRNHPAANRINVTAATGE